MDAQLAERLIRMAEEDGRVRAELAATGELFQGYAPRMAEVHDRNACELETIIDEVGWPGISLVGEEAAAAAWLVLHHAIGQPALQRRCLALLQDAAARGEANPAHAAMLEDRICFFERRPQRYGTQMDWDDTGRMAVWVTEDPENLDARRQAVNMEPLTEMFKADAGEPPQDFATRQKEMLAWAKSVGWF
jgi:hypothetical protein